MRGVPEAVCAYTLKKDETQTRNEAGTCSRPPSFCTSAGLSILLKMGSAAASRPVGSFVRSKTACGKQSSLQ